MAIHLRVVSDETADSEPVGADPGADTASPPDIRPSGVSDSQAKWLQRGLAQPGGKLPLFDDAGKRVSARTVQSCIDKGWAEPWFANPMKPDWLVCKLTDKGRALFVDAQAS